MKEINPKDLRRAFGTFMTGVTVVTTKNADGEKIGFTANSFTSVSLDPPLLSVCLGKSMSCYPVFKDCTYFSINVLAEAQEDVSNLFASYDGDRFAKVDWHEDKNGIPLIDGVTTSFSCKNYQQVDAGDHMILLGEITDFETTGEEGLGYSNQGYFSLGLERGALEAPTSAKTFKVGVIVESEGAVLMQKTDSGMQLPSVEMEDQDGALGAITQHLADNNSEVELGPVYSIFDNPKTGEYSVYFLANGESQQASSLGDLYPVESLAELPMVSDALKTMLDRYALERKTGVFGLYLGDNKAGDIHTIRPNV